MTRPASPARTGKAEPAGIAIPSTPGRTNLTLASPPVAVRPDRLDLFSLRDIVNDTRSRAFCGPTAVAAIVGQPISAVRDAFRLVRHGRDWVRLDRAPAIMGTSRYEVRMVLELFGFTGQWHSVGHHPTLAAFLDDRTGLTRTHPCIVGLTGHWVAVSGWQFCDTMSKGEVVDAGEAPGRRKRVRNVFVITGRCMPSAIPGKDHSAGRAKAAAAQKTRGAYTRFLTAIGARFEIDRDHPGYPTIVVTFADGRKLGMHFDDWKQALGDLKYVLDHPQDADLEEVGEGFSWYDF